MNSTVTSPTVELLGVPVLRRTETCNGSTPNGAFNLSVHVTDACPGRCRFCCNTSKGFTLDVEQFKRDYVEMTKTITIANVFFTGGEPMLHWDKIKECMSVITGARCTIHTTGINLEQIDVPVEISVSRHHWDQQINAEILGINHPTDYLQRCKFRDQLHLACNLIRGYVDDVADIKQYLDFAIDTGIPLVGFIGLMPINDYSRENGVHIPTFDDVDILPYKSYAFRETVCRCANYCYTDARGRIQPFYTRHNQCPNINQGGRIIYKNGVQSWYTQ